jgi:aminocarboxymuconate-semialdehyde decarboxylase
MDLCCCRQHSRRSLLKATLAFGGLAVGGATGLAQDRRSPSAEARELVVDMHAHYFPQSFLDLLKTAGANVGGDYWWTPEGVYVKAGELRSGPAARKIIDLEQRLAEIDAQGIQVHALSLTNPMPYFADAELSCRLASTFNDAVSVASGSAS